MQEELSSPTVESRTPGLIRRRVAKVLAGFVLGGSVGMAAGYAANLYHSHDYETTGTNESNTRISSFNNDGESNVPLFERPLFPVIFVGSLGAIIGMYAAGVSIELELNQDSL